MPRWLLWTLGILAAVVIVAGVAFRVLTAADRAFHAKVGEVRAQGLAVTTAEFRLLAVSNG